tara:strand:+ start:903 stop:1055 length:153 start_codon:yes stop_codon:yes gene_type:complete
MTKEHFKGLEEFENKLINVIQEHYGKNFNISFDEDENEVYIRLTIWKEES